MNEKYFVIYHINSDFNVSSELTKDELNKLLPELKNGQWDDLTMSDKNSILRLKDVKCIEWKKIDD